MGAQDKRNSCLLRSGQAPRATVLIRWPTGCSPSFFAPPLSAALLLSPGDDDTVSSVQKRQRGGGVFPESDFVHPRRNCGAEAAVQPLRPKGQGKAFSFPMVVFVLFYFPAPPPPILFSFLYAPPPGFVAFVPLCFHIYFFGFSYVISATPLYHLVVFWTFLFEHCFVRTLLCH